MNAEGRYVILTINRILYILAMLNNYIITASWSTSYKIDDSVIKIDRDYEINFEKNRI